MFNKKLIKIYFIYFVVFAKLVSAETKNNPAFDNFKNQFNFHLAFSPRKQKPEKEHLENLYLAFIQYSQPNKIFRTYGRINFEVLGIADFSKKLFSSSENNQFAVGLSQDLLIKLFNQNLYCGAGLGIYIKNKVNSRIGSKFTFGQKYFIGYNFGRVNLEIYEKHISNGSITPENSGYDFIGIGVTYNF